MKTPTPAFYLSLFSLCLILSSLLVPLLRKIAYRYSILDKPNQFHKTHQQSVPYLGGLSIVIPVSTVAIFGIFVFGVDFAQQFRFISILCPAIIMAIVGLFDDIRNLSPQLRIIVQSVLAICTTLYLNFIGISSSLTGTPLFDSLISIFWLVGITNAMNFIDNLDGGAAGVTVISSLTLFFLAVFGEQYLIAILSLALVGASIGFLFWNVNPARIYLGDSGALFIGFFLGVALLQFEPKVESRFAAVLIPVFLMALPIIDTSVAVISRILKGKSIFQGGRDHISHRLGSLGFSRRQSASLIWGLAALFSFLGFLINNLAKAISFSASLVGLLAMGLLLISFLMLDSDS